MRYPPWVYPCIWFPKQVTFALSKRICTGYFINIEWPWKAYQKIFPEQRSYCMKWQMSSTLLVLKGTDYRDNTLLKSQGMKQHRVGVKISHWCINFFSKQKHLWTLMSFTYSSLPLIIFSPLQLIERETYAQRQSLLEELRVIKQREADIRRGSEVNSRYAQSGSNIFKYQTK